MPYLTWKSFDWKDDGLLIFEAIKHKDNVFFLDSSLKSRHSQSRYSFLGFEPFYIFKNANTENLFSSLREIFKSYNLDNAKCGFPFFGGAVGYFSYDLGLDLEKISAHTTDDLVLPPAFLNFYDTIIAIDHLKGKLLVFSTGFPEKKYLPAKKRAEERLKQVTSLLSKASLKENTGSAKQVLKIGELTSNFTKKKYLDSVKIAKDYIRKGDIYQVNLSQRFSANTQASASNLYRLLREASPSSFSAYFDCGDFQILSSSPERFLHFDGLKVATRPMKGTRPRGRSKKEDDALKNELLRSVKDKAELTMIVDLLRNDLGRVCEYGSIKVNNMRILERYKTVYQTTALIEGKLHHAKDRFDLVRACFPGGSITGCPKIRSMQIIEELEPSRRSIYTGSLGYLGFNNTMDLNILIRTMLKKDDKIYFQVGGGIVSDSDPENEYSETLVKAQGIFKAIGITV